MTVVHLAPYGLSTRRRLWSSGAAAPTDLGLLLTGGQAAVDFVGRAEARGSLTAQGTGAAALVGGSTTAGQGVLSSAGLSTVTFLGRAEARGSFSAGGQATASLIGSSASST